MLPPNSYNTIPEYYNGTLSSPGGPAWTKGRWQAKSTLRFDGVDDYVSIGTEHVAPPSTVLDTMSITVWFNADSFNTTDARIISKASSSALNDHWFMLSTVQSGGQIVISFRIKAGGTTSELNATTGGLQTGVWTFAAATYDGSLMRLYKDDKLVGSLAKTGNIDMNSTV